MRQSKAKEAFSSYSHLISRLVYESEKWMSENKKFIFPSLEAFIDEIKDEKFVANEIKLEKGISPQLKIKDDKIERLLLICAKKLQLKGKITLRPQDTAKEKEIYGRD